MTTGFALVLLGFLSGAVLGAGFHREDFLGGYSSLRRRLLRLGHIACIALGILNLLHALSPAAQATGPLGGICRAAWVVGSLAMPAVCWLSAWKPGLRRLFPIPVIALTLAASLTLALLSGGTP